MNFTDKLEEAVREQDINQVRAILEAESSAYAKDVTPLVQAARLTAQKNSVYDLPSHEQARQMRLNLSVTNQDIGELLLKKLLSPLCLSSHQQGGLFYEVTQALQEFLESLDRGEVISDPISVANYFAQLPAVQQKQWFASSIGANMSGLANSTDPTNLRP